MELQGIAASDGVGIGPAFFRRTEAVRLPTGPAGDPGREAERLRQASEAFSRQLRAQAQVLRQELGEAEARILTGQLAILQDPVLQEALAAAVKEGQWAETAADSVLSNYADLFAAMDDPFMRQRAADLQDIRQRLLRLLAGEEEPAAEDLEHAVLILQELTPSAAAALSGRRPAALVTQAGGVSGHAAILARALEIPAVLGVEKALEAIRPGQTVVVDGGRGLVLTDPEPRVLSQYLQRQEQARKQRALLEQFRDRPTVTADGAPVPLLINIGSPEEAKAAAAADGVGLFRTEFLYLHRTSAPTEEEQLSAYCAAAKAASGKEVVIRTLDAGGDKAVPCLDMPQEENPFLGHRAIRYCLDAPAVFKPQLRALLRAAGEYPGIRLMLPLVTCLEEIRQTKALLEQCRRELEQKGTPCARQLPVGIMVETPAAVQIADLLAREADFFSLGTNDLTQYLMAADRGNAKVAALSSPFHPAVLRAIRHVIQTARAAGIPAAMCGEAAADPRLIPLWLAWGLDEFSVSPANVLTARRVIRQWTRQDAIRLADQVEKAATSGQVLALLEAALPA